MGAGGALATKGVGGDKGGEVWWRGEFAGDGRQGFGHWA